MNCRIRAAALVAAFALPAMAEDAPADAAPSADDGLETVTVVGTRTERDAADVAATITVIDAERIERELARNIADLVRFEPGVSVGGTGSRFGLTGFNIRGMDGNRVLTLVDGVRVADEFSFGPFLSSRRDFVDVDSLSRAEIARGPISALWGSDAIGGVVSFTTLQPQQYLPEDRGFHAGFKVGYTSADKGASGGLTIATGGDSAAALLRHTRRDASEQQNAGAAGGFGATRELPDPQSIVSDNTVAKVSFAPTDAHRVTLSVGRFAAATDTRILSDYGLVVFGTTVDSRDAADERTRQRVSVNYRYLGASPLFDRLHAGVYTQASDTEQRTRERRTTPARQSQTRRRDSFFDQRIVGAFAQADKAVETDGIRHVLSYGFEYSGTDNASRRDGGTVAADGTPVREFSPLPTRDFPRTEVTQMGFYLQDEISLLDGRLRVTPSVRHDVFDADAQPDSIYLGGNPGSPEPADYEQAETTAKLGAVWTMTPAVAAYARYSQGFRAPPYDDVNVGFTNFLGGYKTIANAHLESERSAGIELGLRAAVDAAQLSIAVFRNDYEDFIESFAAAPAFRASRGIDPADGLLTFQSINRDDVRIEGAEVSLAANLGEIKSALDGWSLRAALAYARGEDLAAQEPLNSVDPVNGVLGIAYAPGSGRLRFEAIFTCARGKDESDIDAGAPRFASSGYGTLDLLADIRIASRARLNVGLFNVTDKAYIRWIDTAGIGTDAPLRFSQPGFNGAATLHVEF